MQILLSREGRELRGSENCGGRKCVSQGLFNAWHFQPFHCSHDHPWIHRHTSGQSGNTMEINQGFWAHPWGPH